MLAELSCRYWRVERLLSVVPSHAATQSNALTVGVAVMFRVCARMHVREGMSVSWRLYTDSVDMAGISRSTTPDVKLHMG